MRVVHLVDRRQGATSGRRNRLLDVLARAVEVGGEGDVATEVVAGGVLGPGEKAVAVEAPQIDALVPRDLRGVAHEAHGELFVTLVATTLLPLPGRRDDAMGHAAVSGAGCGEPQSVLEKGALLTEHTDGQDGLNGGQVPVAVGVEHVSGDGRIPDVQKGLLTAGDVRVGPPVIAGMAQQFGRIGELEYLEAGAEWSVGSRDHREGGRPGIEDVAGLVGVRAYSGDGPKQSVLVGGGRVGDGLVHEVGGSATPGADLAGVLNGVCSLRSTVCGKHEISVMDR